MHTTATRSRGGEGRGEEEERDVGCEHRKKMISDVVVVFFLGGPSLPWFVLVPSASTMYMWKISFPTNNDPSRHGIKIDHLSNYQCRSRGQIVTPSLTTTNVVTNGVPLMTPILVGQSFIIVM